MEVKAWTRRYGLTVDEFLRASLHFTELLLPTLPLSWAPSLTPTPVPTSESAVPSATPGPAEATPPPPDFMLDFFRAALPAYASCADYHRVSAIIDDAVLNLSAKHMEVASMRTASGLRLGEARMISTLADPLTVFGEMHQQVTRGTLDYLSRVGARRSYMNYLPVTGAMLDLSAPGLRDEAQRGLALTRVDIMRWLPVLQHYGWVKPEMTVGERLSSDDATLIVAGFSRMLACITEAVCFLLATNQHLPQANFRQDLMIIHQRGKIVAGAIDRALLQIETSAHQVNGYVGLMTEKLLIFASKAKALQPIYGSEDAVPAVTEARNANVKPLLTVTAGDISEFEFNEAEVT